MVGRESASHPHQYAGFRVGGISQQPEAVRVIRRLELVLDHHHCTGFGLLGADVDPTGARQRYLLLHLFQSQIQRGTKPIDVFGQPWGKVVRLVGPSFPQVHRLQRLYLRHPALLALK